MGFQSIAPDDLATRVINPARLGGALLITSECEIDPDSAGISSIVVPGGAYRSESKSVYREQSWLGATLVEQWLQYSGVAADKIKWIDLANGCTLDPIAVAHSFFYNLPPASPDAFIYYTGPSAMDGSWTLGWHDKKDAECFVVLTPEMLLPEAGKADGPAGNRFVVADCPGGAQMWLRPAARLVGCAAWNGPAQAGGTGGPPLTRWLVGILPLLPEGAVVLPPPSDLGMRQLPAYTHLYWEPLPKASQAAELLWELEAFMKASTSNESACARSTEMLSRGTPALLTTLLETYGAMADYVLLLRALWLLHKLVVHAPNERWFGTMRSALQAVLALDECGPDGGPAVFAATLGLMSACIRVCPDCKELCTGSRWHQILQLILIALDRNQNSKVIASGCKLVAQISSHRASSLSSEEFSAILHNLEQLLLTDWQHPDAEELYSAAAEALLFSSLRNTGVKKALLEDLSKSRKFLILLEESNPRLTPTLLSLLRSLAALQPSPPQVHSWLGEAQLVVIHCLCCHSSHFEVQRWGLAALGAILAAGIWMPEGAAEGIATCVLWALRADIFAGAPLVEQEALFCTYRLWSTQDGRTTLQPHACNVAGLAAGAVARSTREGLKNSEVAVWGLYLLGCIASSRTGVKFVEPYTGTVVKALLSPDCSVDAAIAGSQTVTQLAKGSSVTRDRLQSHRVRLVKALQQMAKFESTSADLPCREQDLLDWARVLSENLGGAAPAVEDEDSVIDAKDWNDEASETFSFKG